MNRQRLFISIVLVALTSLYILGPHFMVRAEEIDCVVEPVPPNNPECKYSTLNAHYDFYDSCFQKYLLRKQEWEERCWRYWDEQKAAQRTSTAPTPEIQIIERIVTREVVVTATANPTQKPTKTPTRFPTILWPTEAKTPTKRPSEPPTGQVRGETSVTLNKQSRILRKISLSIESLIKWVWRIWEGNRGSRPNTKLSLSILG